MLRNNNFRNDQRKENQSEILPHIFDCNVKKYETSINFKKQVKKTQILDRNEKPQDAEDVNHEQTEKAKK
jgi:hypothetical protein